MDALDDLTDVVVTADTPYTQRAHAEDLHARGAHYTLTAKSNQPSLHTQLKTLPWQDVPVADSVQEKAHGRVERRTVKFVTVSGILGQPPQPRHHRPPSRRRHQHRRRPP
ncbi:hypothetical protein [Saccharopolyspora sp. NPDC002376]